ncbi:hypothetical protein L7F22_001029 [Adiantum nelumboides]|nr:hypothetical protein [Adiantum nelumboides]
METGLKLSLHDAGDPPDVTLYQTAVGCLIMYATQGQIFSLLSHRSADLCIAQGRDHCRQTYMLFQTEIELVVLTHECPQMVFVSCLTSYAWLSKKQPTMATFSCEVEYKAIFTATVECVWLRRLMVVLGVGQDTPNNIYIDSQSALAVARNPVSHAGTKLIEVYYHNVRERLSTGEISLAYVPTHDNFADLFTKALSREKLEAFCKALGLLPFVD